MKKPARQPREKILYAPEYEKPPAADRLRAMDRALATSSELDATMRSEIRAMISSEIVRQANEETRHQRGEVIAQWTWFAVEIAKELMEKHSAKKRVAVRIAARSIRNARGLDSKDAEEDVAKIEKGLDKLMSSDDGYIKLKDGKFTVAFINEQLMAYAVSRLNRKVIRFPSLANAPIGIIAKLIEPTQSGN